MKIKVLLKLCSSVPFLSMLHNPSAVGVSRKFSVSFTNCNSTSRCYGHWAAQPTSCGVRCFIGWRIIKICGTFCLLLIPSTSRYVCCQSLEDGRSMVNLSHPLPLSSVGVLHQLRLLIKTAYLIFLFLPLILLHPLTRLSIHLNDLWWRIFLTNIQRAGPLITKLAQWASTRRDLLPGDACQRLAHLQTSVTPHPWWYTKKRLYQALGPRWKKLFVRIDPTPVGCGCVAQVYKAYIPLSKVRDEQITREFLDSEGEVSYGSYILGFGTLFSKDGDDDTDSADNDDLFPVALKVLHPNIKEQVHLEMCLVRRFASLITTCWPSCGWMGLVECADEFHSLLLRQINLRQEAWGLENFTDNFSSSHLIQFPRPIHPYARNNILVETWEDGIPLSQFLNGDLNLTKDEEVRNELFKTLAQLGVDAILKMIFKDNFVHGDLHPGNILVQGYEQYLAESQIGGATTSSSTEHQQLILQDVCDTIIVSVEPVENPLKLVFLDVGIFTKLSNCDLENFKAVFKAVIYGEYEKIGELMLENAPSHNCKDPDHFKKELADVVCAFKDRSITLRQVNVASLLHRVFSVLIRNQVKVESNFASIIFALFIVEGIGRSLDPDIDLIQRAKTMLY